MKATRLILVAATIVTAGCLHPCAATDLGVQGTTWPIIEIDMRQFLAEQAAHVNWSNVSGTLVQTGKNYLHSLPHRDIPTVRETTTRWIDPTVILSRDIMAPQKDQAGEWHWAVLYRKGTRFNPLSVERPVKAMLFFDSASDEQRQFVEQALAHYPDRIIPVDVNGNDPEPLSKSWGRPLFEATDTMLARFPVFAVPALLYPGSGAERLRLGMTAFARPYVATDIATAWPEVARHTTFQGTENAHTR